MNKKVKNLVICALALGLSSTFYQPIQAAEPTATASNVVSNQGWAYAFKAVKWVVTLIDNNSFYRTPVKAKPWGDFGVASSSGHVYFGPNSTEAKRVKFKNNVAVKYNTFDAFAETSVSGWLENLTIFIENSSGTQIAGGQVGHNQHVTTKFLTPKETYTTYYVYNKRRKWDCWIIRYDHRNNISGASTLTAQKKDGTTGDFVYNPLQKKHYLIPSYTKDLVSLYSKNGVNEDSILTANELVDQFYDPQLKCSVNQLKNYNIGDNLFVEDNIVKTEYNRKHDYTTIYFGSEKDPFIWYFKGDLRSAYPTGKKAKFKFKVVEEYSDGVHTFETLDLFKDSFNLKKSGQKPKIEDYQ